MFQIFFTTLVCDFMLISYILSRSQMKGMSIHRKHNTYKSKLILLSFGFLACVMRATSILMFFTPTLGLANVLRHLQGS